MRLALVLLLAACNVPVTKFTPIGDPDGPGPDDAAIDAAPDAVATFCYGARPWCFQTEPAGSKDLQGGSYDTTGCIGGFDVEGACMIGAESFTLGDTRFTGNRPLVVVATKSITMVENKTVDLGSAYNGANGPGALNTICGTAPKPLADGGTGGGGVGGSFGGRGGNGGGCNNGGCVSSALAAVPVPMPFHGGCLGGIGVSNQGMQSTQNGGVGGGAGMFVAGEAITVAGKLFAGGSGGGGSTNTFGAHGGGSGGFIGLEAPTIAVPVGATICAHGGGGGASENGAFGGRGNDGCTTNGSGGNQTNGGTGNDGGAGSSTNTCNGGNGLNGNLTGGSGGGGGCGFIVIPLSANLNKQGTITPTETR